LAAKFWDDRQQAPAQTLRPYIAKTRPVLLLAIAPPWQNFGTIANKPRRKYFAPAQMLRPSLDRQPNFP